MCLCLVPHSHKLKETQDKIVGKGGQTKKSLGLRTRIPLVEKKKSLGRRVGQESLLLIKKQLFEMSFLFTAE